MKAALLNTSAHFYTPTIFNTLLNPIGSKHFNFNKFVNKLDMKALLDDISTLPSDCTDSRFVDKDLNHIINGNLKIIENNKLCKHFRKGIELLII